MSTKKTFAFIIIGVVVIGVAAFALLRRPAQSVPREDHSRASEHTSPSPLSKTKPVPAHYEMEPPRTSLPPTLDPEKFSGRTREAYRVVREVPQLIAQLPCYCYCDRGYGHKSLHSCYVDDHAAHCAVCVDEVLMAYDLQKRGLSAQQIREQIIAQYAE